jgi:F420-non-reducing hydrogenase iron-sulfur subunit
MALVRTRGFYGPGHCAQAAKVVRQRCLLPAARPPALARARIRFMNPRALKTYVFYCSNNLDADRFTGACRALAGDTVKTISLPCSGKVDLPYLIKAFETGADGVVIVTCKKNECRHFEGNLRANKRAQAVESLLEEIGMGAGRMAVLECANGGVEQVLGEIKRFIERLRNLPPSGVRNGGANPQERTVA